jgi:hypothetical protein
MYSDQADVGWADFVDDLLHPENSLNQSALTVLLSYPLIYINMSILTQQNNSSEYPTLDILLPLRQRVDQVDFHNRFLAHLVCRLIPCTCPFERDLSLLGNKLHIPSLCKLNPLYNEFVALRFRALSYLSEICGEDVTKYIC